MDLARRQFDVLPPLSLYIHLPWCERKCPYCDFNSHSRPETLPEAAYVDALLSDLELELPLVQGRAIESIFIGGGTPSLFSAEAYARLFAGLHRQLRWGEDVEITLEANPGSSERGRFAEYRAIGINRLSIGIQSFDDRMLEALGRVHSGADAHRAIEIAHASGFDNFNLDLMFALPGQSEAMAEADLHHAIAARPAHLSLYELTIEPNTLFARFPPERPDDDTMWAMQQRAEQQLQSRGFERYEVSAWAQPGARCRHNLNYWRFGDYLGIGAGAHAKLSHAERGEIVRRVRKKHPERYLQSAGSPACIEIENPIALQDSALEFMLNAMRLVDGVPATLLAERTGLDAAPWERLMQQAEQRGLLLREQGRLAPSPQGLLFLGDLLELFLPEPAATGRKNEAKPSQPLEFRPNGT